MAWECHWCHEPHDDDTQTHCWSCRTGRPEKEQEEAKKKQQEKEEQEKKKK